MTGKSILFLAVLVSSGIAVERTVIKTPAWKNRGIDKVFVSATDVGNSMDGKRGVFGQDKEGRFFSLYEKDPNHPQRTIIKFVRAKYDRRDKGLLEYVEYDAGTAPWEMHGEGLFRLAPGEVRRRLAQNGPTY